MSDDAERERARYEALSAVVDGYRRERDDAREQLYLTKAELGRWVDRETKAARERDEARAELAGLPAWQHACEQSRLDLAEAEAVIARRETQIDEARASVADAYRRGAEAMRKRCAMWIKHNSHEDGLGMGSQRMESALAALPIPEEP